MKQIKSFIKDEDSIFLSKKSKGVDISRAIYDLVHSGIKGEMKKDVLLTTLSELTVSNSSNHKTTNKIANLPYYYSTCTKILHL